MPYQLAIFDFDGTIADTMEANLEISNRLAKEFGYKEMTYDEAVEMRQENAHTALKRIGVPLRKVPAIALRFKKEIRKQIGQLAPMDGIPEVLEFLKSQKIPTGIITSNSEKNVRTFLKKNNLLHYFEFIHSALNLFGKDKVLTKQIAKSRLKPEQVVYIGDETRDIEAAKLAGVHIISVSWGLNSREILQSYQPDYLVDAPHEIIKLL